MPASIAARFVRGKRVRGQGDERRSVAGGFRSADMAGRGKPVEHRHTNVKNDGAKPLGCGEPRAVAPKMLQRDAAADFVVFREKNVDAFEVRRRIAHEMVCGTGLPALRQQPCQKACGAHGFTSQPSKR
jgi:hypothetical protein